MTDKEMKQWQVQNGILQEIYWKFQSAKGKEKDKSLLSLSQQLEWPPFLDYCISRGALLQGITGYGLDSVTEKCISEIDSIAKGKKITTI